MTGSKPPLTRADAYAAVVDVNQAYHRNPQNFPLYTSRVVGWLRPESVRFWSHEDRLRTHSRVLTCCRTWDAATRTWGNASVMCPPGTHDASGCSCEVLHIDPKRPWRAVRTRQKSLVMLHARGRFAREIRDMGVSFLESHDPAVLAGMREEELARICPMMICEGFVHVSHKRNARGDFSNLPILHVCSLRWTTRDAVAGTLCAEWIDRACKGGVGL